jgi:O-antigen/teichoic acid export membrane protein
MLTATLAQLVVGLSLTAMLTPTLAATGYVLAMAAGSLVAVVVLAVTHFPTPWFGPSVLKRDLLLSVPFVGQGIANWVVGQLDRVVIAGVLGAAQLGPYQVAYMLGSVLGMVLEGFQAGWAGRYFATVREGKVPALWGLTIRSVWAAGVAVLALSALAPAAYTLLAPGYSMDGVVTVVVAAACIPRVFYFNAILVLLDRGQSGRILASTLVAGVVTVIGLAVLVPVFGAVGGAVVTLIAFWSQSLVVIASAFPVGVAKLLGWPTLPTLVFLVAGLGLVTVAEARPSVGLWIGTFAAIAVLGLLWRVIKAIDRLVSAPGGEPRVQETDGVG